MSSANELLSSVAEEASPHDVDAVRPKRRDATVLGGANAHREGRKRTIRRANDTKGREEDGTMAGWAGHDIYDITSGAVGT